MSEPSSASSALRRIPRQTRDTAVLQALAAHVQAAGFKPGDRLHPERILADRLGVSRATVREALKRWQALGIVDMRKGSGTYLLAPVSPDSIHVPITVADAGDATSLMHALEIRGLLEEEAAAACAARASEEQLAELGTLLEALETAFHERDGHNEREDWAFHQAVLRAAGNPFFEQIVTALSDVLQSFWRYPLDIQDFGRSSFPYHRMVYEAIRRRDPAGARAEMLKIIACAREDILRAFPHLRSSAGP